MKHNRYVLYYRHRNDHWGKQFETKWLVVAVGKFLALRGEYDFVTMEFKAKD